MEPIKQIDVKKEMTQKEDSDKPFAVTLEAFFENQRQKENQLEQKYTNFTCNMF